MNDPVFISDFEKRIQKCRCFFSIRSLIETRMGVTLELLSGLMNERSCIFSDFEKRIQECISFFSIRRIINIPTFFSLVLFIEFFPLSVFMSVMSNWVKETLKEQTSKFPKSPNVHF